MTACILGGSRRKEFKGTHTTHWLRLRLHEEYFGVGSVSILLPNSCGPLLTLCCFGLAYKIQTGAMHHCQNIMLMRYSVLVFTFCNTWNDLTQVLWSESKCFKHSSIRPQEFIIW